MAVYREPQNLFNNLTHNTKQNCQDINIKLLIINAIHQHRNLTTIRIIHD